jgi:hypothetical protein
MTESCRLLSLQRYAPWLFFSGVYGAQANYALDP